MAKPKNMTPEKEAEWRERVRVQRRRWNEANREKIYEWHKEYQKKNREKANEYGRRYEKKNRAVINERRRAKRRSDPERTRELDRRPKKHLADSYVAAVLHLPVSTLRKHPDLLEAKREQIKATRQLKKQNEPKSDQS